VDDVFAVQDEITNEITKAMDVKFYIGEGARDIPYGTDEK